MQFPQRGKAPPRIMYGSPSRLESFYEPGKPNFNGGAIFGRLCICCWPPLPQQTGGSMYTDPRSQQRNSNFVLHFARFLRPPSSEITIFRKNRRRLRCTKCYAILAPFGEFRQARPLRPTLNPLLREPLRPPNNNLFLGCLKTT
jgi:hypothetical protein